MTARDWVKIVGVAFVLRAIVALVWLRQMPLVSDAASYFDFAGELLADFPGRAAYYWPPGNSLVMAAVFAVTGKSIVVARLSMIAMSVGGVVYTALAARLLTTDTRVEKIAAWIGALYVPAILLAGQSYAQHLSALCMLAFAFHGMRALERAHEDRAALVDAIVAGIAFGLGCLTRPSMLSVAPVLLVFWILALRRAPARSTRVSLALRAALFAVVAAAFVVPAQLHNRALGAGFTISTNNERNLFLGNNPHTPNYKTSHLGQRSLEELDPDTREYLRGFYERSDARAAMQKEAVDFIVHHPGTTAYRTLNRATSFWGFDYLGPRLVQAEKEWGTKKLLPLLALEAGAYTIVMVLALVGIFACKDACTLHDGRARRWLVALALAYEIPYMLAFSGGTYHFPVIPLVMPFAAVALTDGARGVVDRVRLAPSRARIATLVALAAFVVIQAEYAYYSLAMSG